MIDQRAVSPGPANAEEARIAILFSGGVDCSILAVLASHHLPAEEPIDLLNVAFENPRVQKAPSEQYSTPDRLTGLATLRELQRISPDRTWRFVEINITYEESMRHQNAILDLMAPQNTVMDHVRLALGVCALLMLWYRASAWRYTLPLAAKGS